MQGQNNNQSGSEKQLQRYNAQNRQSQGDAKCIISSKTQVGLMQEEEVQKVNPKVVKQSNKTKE